MGNQHALWNRNPLRRWLAALAVGLLWVSGAQAKVTEYDAFQAFMAQASGANKYTVGFGTNGTPLVTNGVPGPTAARNMNFSHAAGGWPSATGTGQIPLPSGNLATKMSKPVSAMAAGKAIARFAGRVAGPLAVGFALYDLIKELGMDAEPDPDGEGWNVFRQNDGIIYQYRGNAPSGGYGPWSTTQSGACTSAQAYYNSLGLSFIASEVVFAAGGADNAGTCDFRIVNRSTGAFVQWTGARYSQRDGGTQNTTKDYLGEQALADEIAVKDGWPSSSAIDRTLADVANYPGPVDLGPLFDTNINDFKMEPQAQKVDGPVKTSTSSDGTVKKTQLSCDWVIPMYSTLQYKCWETTTEAKPETQQVTTTNPDGTTTTKTVPVTTTATTTLPDGTTATYSVPKTNTVTTTTSKDDGTAGTDGKDCDATSTGLDCAQLDTPTGTVPKSTFSLTYAAEVLGLGGGACPADKVVTLSGGRTLKAFDMQSGCEKITTYVKPLILMLSAWIAFLILMPGGATVRGGGEA